jgi:hypothetical protein
MIIGFTVRIETMRINEEKDKLWLIIWSMGILAVWTWNKIFLHGPALIQIERAFFNTMLISLLVILFATTLGWLTTLVMYFSRTLNLHLVNTLFTFILNLIRSIPQIIGILVGYIFLTTIIYHEIVVSDLIKIVLMATILSFFIFLEVYDLLSDRIDHFKKLDFFNAMRVCGIRESRIINREIILRSSFVHLLNKLIAIFGIAIFLQCSIDFIISVGLSTDVSSVNLPDTLGSLLAKLDSKQDILAIGYSFSHLNYFSKIFFEHLQGVTVAYLIVFTLLCIYQISNGYAKRHRL